MAEFVRFPSTFWTIMKNDPGGARSKVYSAYRTPVFGFIRNRGFSESDADDLTQEVFTRVCREDFLTKADKNKGKFRSLLLAITRNVIMEELRRRHRDKGASLNQTGGVEEPEAPSQEDGAEFDRLWMQNLIRLGLEHLQRESRTDGPRYYDAFVLNKMQDLSYDEVAKKLNARVSDVTNWIHHAREKMKEFLTGRIREYASSEEEYAGEKRTLSETLG